MRTSDRATGWPSTKIISTPYSRPQLDRIKEALAGEQFELPTTNLSTADGAALVEMLQD